MPIRRPYRRRRVVRRRRRVARKSRNSLRSVATVPRSTGIPDYMFVKLNYTSLKQFSATAGSAVSYVWNMNSLYDPDASAGGSQPMYFDQLSAMYNKYCVFACKVSLRATCASSTTNMYHPWIVLVPYAGVGGWTSEQQVLQAPFAQYKILIPGQSQALIRGYYPIHKIFGVSKRAISIEDGYSSGVGAEPTNLCYVQFRVNNNDGSTAVSFGVEIKLTYYVKFFKKYQVAAS